jgi:predicted PurR-regulated permease PerM
MKELSNKQTGDGGVLTRERVLVLTLMVATGLAFYVCYLLTRPFLPALAWALALAVVAHPLHEWLSRLIRNGEVAAVASVALVFIVIVAPSYFVMNALVSEAVAGARMLIGDGETGGLRTMIDTNPYLASALRWIESHVDLRGGLEQLATNLTSYASSFLAGSVWVVMQLLITLFVLFYFFRDRREIMNGIRKLVPLSEDETQRVFARVTDTIYAIIYGTIVVSIVQGVLGGLIFWLLGLGAPVLWGFVMAVLAMVPTLGAFVIWLPAAILLALQGDWIKAALLAGWGMTAISLIDNLLYPTLVGKRLRLHTLPVFFAVLGGVFVFGASGIILGPLALALTVALLEVWRQRTAEGHTADTAEI